MVETPSSLPRLPTCSNEKDAIQSNGIQNSSMRLRKIDESFKAAYSMCAQCKLKKCAEDVYRRKPTTNGGCLSSDRYKRRMECTTPATPRSRYKARSPQPVEFCVPCGTSCTSCHNGIGLRSLTSFGDKAIKPTTSYVEVESAKAMPSAHDTFCARRHAYFCQVN